MATDKEVSAGLTIVSKLLSAGQAKQILGEAALRLIQSDPRDWFRHIDSGSIVLTEIKFKRGGAIKVDFYLSNEAPSSAGCPDPNNARCSCASCERVDPDRATSKPTRRAKGGA